MKFDLWIFFDFIGRPHNEVMTSTEHTQVWWERMSWQHTWWIAHCLEIYMNFIMYLAWWYQTWNIPQEQPIYFVMYFIPSFLCVIHLRLFNYSTIHLLLLLMTFYFLCYKAIFIYIYFVTSNFCTCVSHEHGY
jgi:hypothetical protein